MNRFFRMGVLGIVDGDGLMRIRVWRSFWLPRVLLGWIDLLLDRFIIRLGVLVYQHLCVIDMNDYST